MPEQTTASQSFEELWQSVIDEPVRQDNGDDDDELLTAAQLVAWLRRIADDCLSDQLITDEAHAELQQCSDTYAHVLGAIPPEALREKLKTLSEFEV